MFGKNPGKNPVDKSNDFDFSDDFDSDLDSFGGDIDGYDSGYNGDKESKNRNPVLGKINDVGRTIGRAGKAATTGFGEGISKKLDRVMPEVKDAYRAGTEIASEASMLKNDALEKARPVWNETKRTVRDIATKIGPLPLNLDKRILKLIGEEEKKYEEPSIHEQRASHTSQVLDEIFKLQTQKSMEQQRDAEVNRFLDRRIGQAQHKELATLTARIASQSTFQTAFIRGTFTAYLKKDLEIKYKQMYLAEDTLGVLRNTANMLNAQLDAIRKNTGLPEAQKVRTSEVFKHQLKEKFTSTFSNKLGNYFSKMRENAMKEFVEPAIDALDMGNAMLGNIGAMLDLSDLDDNPKTFREKYLSPSKLIQYAVRGIGRFAGGKSLTNFLDKIPPETRAVISSYAKRGKQGIALLLDDINTGKINLDGFVGEKLQSLIQAIAPNLRGENTLENVSYTMRRQDQKITRQFTDTVERVIPGYLAMQTKWLEAIARGARNPDQIKEKYWDFKTNRFTTAEEHRKDFTREIFGTEEERAIRTKYDAQQIRDVVNRVTSNHERLASKENLEKELRSNVKNINQFTLNLSRSPYGRKVTDVIDYCKQIADNPNNEAKWPRDFINDAFKQINKAYIPSVCEFIRGIGLRPNGEYDYNFVQYYTDELTRRMVNEDSRFRSAFFDAMENGDIQFLQRYGTADEYGEYHLNKDNIYEDSDQSNLSNSDIWHGLSKTEADKIDPTSGNILREKRHKTIFEKAAKGVADAVTGYSWQGVGGRIAAWFGANPIAQAIKKLGKSDKEKDKIDADYEKRRDEIAGKSQSWLEENISERLQKAINWTAKHSESFENKVILRVIKELDSAFSPAIFGDVDKFEKAFFVINKKDKTITRADPNDPLHKAKVFDWLLSIKDLETTLAKFKKHRNPFVAQLFTTIENDYMDYISNITDAQRKAIEAIEKPKERYAKINEILEIVKAKYDKQIKEQERVRHERYAEQYRKDQANKKANSKSSGGITDDTKFNIDYAKNYNTADLYNEAQKQTDLLQTIADNTKTLMNIQLSKFADEHPELAIHGKSYLYENITKASEDLKRANEVNKRSAATQMDDVYKSIKKNANAHKQREDQLNKLRKRTTGSMGDYEAKNASKWIKQRRDNYKKLLSSMQALTDIGKIPNNFNSSFEAKNAGTAVTVIGGPKKTEKDINELNNETQLLEGLSLFCEFREYLKQEGNTAILDAIVNKTWRDKHHLSISEINDWSSWISSRVSRMRLGGRNLNVSSISSSPTAFDDFYYLCNADINELDSLTGEITKFLTSTGKVDDNEASDIVADKYLALGAIFVASKKVQHEKERKYAKLYRDNYNADEGESYLNDSDKDRGEKSALKAIIRNNFASVGLNRSGKRIKPLVRTVGAINKAFAAMDKKGISREKLKSQSDLLKALDIPYLNKASEDVKDRVATNIADFLYKVLPQLDEDTQDKILSAFIDNSEAAPTREYIKKSKTVNPDEVITQESIEEELAKIDENETEKRERYLRKKAREAAKAEAKKHSRKRKRKAHAFGGRYTFAEGGLLDADSGEPFISDSAAEAWRRYSKAMDDADPELNNIDRHGGAVNKPTEVLGGKGIAGEAGSEAIIPAKGTERSKVLIHWVVKKAFGLNAAAKVLKSLHPSRDTLAKLAKNGELGKNIDWFYSSNNSDGSEYKDLIDREFHRGKYKPSISSKATAASKKQWHFSDWLKWPWHFDKHKNKTADGENSTASTDTNADKKAEKAEQSEDKAKNKENIIYNKSKSFKGISDRRIQERQLNALEFIANKIDKGLPFLGLTDIKELLSGLQLSLMDGVDWTKMKGKSLFGKLKDKGIHAYNSAKDFLIRNGRRVWNTAKSLAGSAWNLGTDLASSAFGVGKTVIGAGWRAAKSIGKTAYDLISSAHPLQKLGSLAKAGLHGIGKVGNFVFGSNGILGKAWNTATDVVGKVAGWLTDKADPYTDVYIKDPATDELKLVIKGTDIESNQETKRYFYTKNGTTEYLKSAYGIEYPVYESANKRRKKPRCIISKEDIKRGLFDVEGNKLSKGKDKSRLSRILTAPIRLIGGAIRKIKNFGKGLWNGLINLGKGLGEGISGFFRGFAEFGNGLLTGFDNIISKQVGTRLLDIYELLDARLKGKKVRTGSYEDYQQRRKEREEAAKNKKSPEAKEENKSGGIFGWFKGLFGKLFGKKSGEEGEENNSNDGIFSSIADTVSDWWLFKQFFGDKKAKGGKAAGKAAGAVAAKKAGLFKRLGGKLSFGASRLKHAYYERLANKMGAPKGVEYFDDVIGDYRYTTDAATRVKVTADAKKAALKAAGKNKLNAARSAASNAAGKVGNTLKTAGSNFLKPLKFVGSGAGKVLTAAGSGLGGATAMVGKGAMNLLGGAGKLISGTAGFLAKHLGLGTIAKFGAHVLTKFLPGIGWALTAYELGKAIYKGATDSDQVKLLRPARFKAYSVPTKYWEAIEDLETDTFDAYKSGQSGVDDERLRMFGEKIDFITNQKHSFDDKADAYKDTIENRTAFLKEWYKYRFGKAYATYIAVFYRAIPNYDKSKKPWGDDISIEQAQLLYKVLPEVLGKLKGEKYDVTTLDTKGYRAWIEGKKAADKAKIEARKRDKDDVHHGDDVDLSSGNKKIKNFLTRDLDDAKHTLSYAWNELKHGNILNALWHGGRGLGKLAIANITLPFRAIGATVMKLATKEFWGGSTKNEKAWDKARRELYGFKESDTSKDDLLKELEAVTLDIIDGNRPAMDREEIREWANRFVKAKDLEVAGLRVAYAMRQGEGIARDANNDQMDPRDNKKIVSEFANYFGEWYHSVFTGVFTLYVEAVRSIAKQAPGDNPNPDDIPEESRELALQSFYRAGKSIAHKFSDLKPDVQSFCRWLITDTAGRSKIDTKAFGKDNGLNEFDRASNLAWSKAKQNFGDAWTKLKEGNLVAALGATAKGVGNTWKAVGNWFASVGSSIGHAIYDMFADTDNEKCWLQRFKYYGVAKDKIKNLFIRKAIENLEDVELEVFDGEETNIDPKEIYIFGSDVGFLPKSVGNENRSFWSSKRAGMIEVAKDAANFAKSIGAADKAASQANDPTSLKGNKPKSTQQIIKDEIANRKEYVRFWYETVFKPVFNAYATVVTAATERTPGDSLDVDDISTKVNAEVYNDFEKKVMTAVGGFYRKFSIDVDGYNNWLQAKADAEKGNSNPLIAQLDKQSIRIQEAMSKQMENFANSVERFGANLMNNSTKKASEKLISGVTDDIKKAKEAESLALGDPKKWAEIYGESLDKLTEKFGFKIDNFEEIGFWAGLITTGGSVSKFTALWRGALLAMSRTMVVAKSSQVNDNSMMEIFLKIMKETYTYVFKGKMPDDEIGETNRELAKLVFQTWFENATNIVSTISKQYGSNSFNAQSKADDIIDKVFKQVENGESSTTLAESLGIPKEIEITTPDGKTEKQQNEFIPVLDDLLTFVNTWRMHVFAVAYLYMLNLLTVATKGDPTNPPDVEPPYDELSTMQHRIYIKAYVDKMKSYLNSVDKNLYLFSLSKFLDWVKANRQIKQNAPVDSNAKTKTLSQGAIEALQAKQKAAKEAQAKAIAAIKNKYNNKNNKNQDIINHSYDRSDTTAHREQDLASSTTPSDWSTKYNQSTYAKSQRTDIANWATEAKAYTPDETAKIMWEYMTKEWKLSPEQAAAIMGNSFQESSLNPAAVNKSSGAKGLFQWLGARLNGSGKFDANGMPVQADGKTPRSLKPNEYWGLMNFALAKGKSWTDPKVQMEYLNWEMSNNNYERSKFQQFMSIQNPEDPQAQIIASASAWRQLIERCGANEAADSRRQAYALSMYRKLGGKSLEPNNTAKDAQDGYLNEKYSSGISVYTDDSDTSKRDLNYDDFRSYDNRPIQSHSLEEMKNYYSNSDSEYYKKDVKDFNFDEVKVGESGVVSPADSKVITSLFGKRNVPGGSKNHKGIDLRARFGDPIRAAMDGEVISAGGSYNTILIKHSNGLTTQYMHCSRINVKPKDKVKAGQVIALAGGKGPNGPTQYAAHLHFGVKDSHGNWINPAAFLSKTGKIDLEIKGKGKYDSSKDNNQGDLGDPPHSDAGTETTDKQGQNTTDSKANSNTPSQDTGSSPDGSSNSSSTSSSTQPSVNSTPSDAAAKATAANPPVTSDSTPSPGNPSPSANGNNSNVNYSSSSAGDKNPNVKTDNAVNAADAGNAYQPVVNELQIIEKILTEIRDNVAVASGGSSSGGLMESFSKIKDKIFENSQANDTQKIRDELVKALSENTTAINKLQSSMETQANAALSMNLNRNNNSNQSIANPPVNLNKQ